MITIDCNAKERVQLHSFICCAAKPNPHRLDLYETWDPWQDPSNVDSPKWLYETQDLIHGELLQKKRKKKEDYYETNHQLENREEITDHAQSYSQISASPLPAFLQSWQHLPPRNNDCFFQIRCAKRPPIDKVWYVHLVTRSQEIVISNMIIVSRCKLCLWLWS